ncbi:MAG TPA: hypothetical protein VMB84_14350, partial [Stellaceae bacterium]|nr:hypothetical protein [Stellaceae bacterium]
PEAAADVAAARALSDAAMVADEGIIARAAALVASPAPALVITLPPPRHALRSWYSAASWSGLAAAVICAGWLGFALGDGLFGVAGVSRPGDDQSASEFLDPAPLLLRDFTDNSQI